jgi:hypothetical protein
MIHNLTNWPAYVMDVEYTSNTIMIEIFLIKNFVIFQ